jgi:hypothetical protein
MNNYEIVALLDLYEKQAPVEMIASIGHALIAFGFVALAVYVSLRVERYMAEGGDGEARVAHFATGMVLVIALILGCQQVAEALQCYHNPGMWAVGKVLSRLALLL